MGNILLIEPDYRAKFPPLGLMRISTFHKDRGDMVTFARGKVPALRNADWHRIYISSLFTYELPRTVETIKYYAHAVTSPSAIFVGGIGATLLPEYIRERVQCSIIEGPLDKPDMLGLGTPPIAALVPDYDMLDSVTWKYEPQDSYFCRVTTGCIRRCKFCAVPRLEPTFRYLGNLGGQIREVRARFGEKQNLVLLDNNILATDQFKNIIEDIRREGFEAGAKRNGRKRTVDFNQGIDARLITPQIAKLLASICLSPVRFAFDFDAVEDSYRRAVHIMADAGFNEFTTYVMFNFDDTPLSLYKRLMVNIELSRELGIRVTGFPMRYVPIDDINRQYVSNGWRWRYLRGIQCILLATHGIVSPNPEFFQAAFGESYDEFLEIISMPDRYIIHRNRYKDREALDWKKLYRKLSQTEREEFLSVLAILNKSRNRKADIASHRKFKPLLEHYYPGG
ncbi:MAG TPA: cobalamin-binding domain-containing protein [Firmicutes bacterium]|nr:cobalamin-binding domain-containing protein [Bacillota bacterium]